MFLLIFSICLLLALVYYVILPYKRYLFYRKYGNGEFVPLFGEVMQFQRGLDKHGDMDYIFKHHLDSDPDQKLYVVNSGRNAKIRIFDTELVKEFFLKTNLYQKSSTRVDNFQRFLHEGIVFAEGAKWKTSRRLFSKAFNFEYLKSFTPRIEEATERVFKKLIDSNEMESVDVISLIQQITGQVIFLSFFGETLEEVTFQGVKLPNALAYTLGKLGDQTISMKYFLFGKHFFELGLTEDDRKYNKYLAEIQEYMRDLFNKKIDQIEKEIKETGTTKQQSIIASLIMDGELDQISREQLYQDLNTFYLAGIDTTGHLVGMLVYYMSQDRSIYSKLQKEVDANTDYSANNLAQLPYLNAVIKEGLRYYGPANFVLDRVAQVDHKLGDIPIKKGTLVTVYHISIHRNAKLYKNPHSFDPSRWLSGSLINEVGSYGFVSFSAGARNCIGQHLAYLEARIILNIFMKTFDFECPKNYNLRLAYKLLPEPVDPLPIKLIPRKQGWSSATKPS